MAKEPNSGRWRPLDTCWVPRHEGRLKTPCVGDPNEPDDPDGGGGVGPSDLWTGEWHLSMWVGSSGSYRGYGNRPMYGNSYVFGELYPLDYDDPPLINGLANLEYLQWSISSQLQIGFDDYLPGILGLDWNEYLAIQIEFPGYGLVSPEQYITESISFPGTWEWFYTLPQSGWLDVIVRTWRP